MLGDHRGAHLEEVVQVSLVSEPNIDVHAVLHGLGFGNLLEEEHQRTVRGVDGNHRIGFRCQAQGGEPGDLGLVVGPDPPAKRGLPELSELRRMPTVQHDPNEVAHPANATGPARAACQMLGGQWGYDRAAGPTSPCSASLAPADVTGTRTPLVND